MNLPGASLPPLLFCPFVLLLAVFSLFDGFFHFSCQSCNVSIVKVILTCHVILLGYSCKPSVNFEECWTCSFRSLAYLALQYPFHKIIPTTPQISVNYWPVPKNHWTLWSRGLSLYFTGFQTTRNLRSHDSYGWRPAFSTTSNPPPQAPTWVQLGLKWPMDTKSLPP